MAMPSGPAPKDGPKHGRYTSPLDDARTLNTVVAPASTAPTLTELGEGYVDATRAWWATWMTAPQSSVFTHTDWQRLQMLAPLIDRYYRAVTDPDVKPHSLVPLLAEIRQNESLLGATHVDRLKGRIKVEATDGPAGGVPAGVTALDDYRKMLGA